MSYSFPARRLIAAIALGLVAVPAAAQFRLDNSPSGFRAAQSEALKRPGDDGRPDLSPRMRSLSPLGGAQGTPLTATPIAPAAPVQTYAGVPGAATEDSVFAPASDDPSKDDPNRPRKPLQPGSLKKGVAPRK